MAIEFTRNKQVVRDLQCEQIGRHLTARLGRLRYFGLCSPGMGDVLDWRAMFDEFHVAERGIDGVEWLDQHELLLTASLNGISEKVVLLRGDIDEIVLAGRDPFGTTVRYPFDVISLDYSGGLFYRDNSGGIPRLKAIEHVITEQAHFDRSWLLFISVCLDAPHDGEVKRTLENIKTELGRFGISTEALMRALLHHEREEVRYKVYVPYFVSQIATRSRVRCETAKTIIYRGNNDVPMMSFQFHLQPDNRTFAPRFPQERLVQVINAPFREIRRGKTQDVTLGLPKLRARTTAKGSRAARPPKAKHRPK